MSRIARVVVAGIPYHVTQRGNGRQQVFFDDGDRMLYVDLLRENSAQAGLVLWAYCIMPNHVHLIGVPDRTTSMARALGRTHAGYARHFNLRTRSCGHVWQARFFSCPLDGAHLWRATAYVERNPVRAHMVAEAGHYRWSSATAHLTGCDPENLIELGSWRREYDPGRVLGGNEFVEELEGRAGRRLRPRPSGRPRKGGMEEDQAI